MGEQQDGEHESAQLHHRVGKAESVAPAADDAAGSHDPQELNQLEQSQHSQQAQLFKFRPERENVVRDHRDQVDPEPARHVVRCDGCVAGHCLSVLVKVREEKLDAHVGQKHEVYQPIEPEKGNPILPRYECNLVRERNSREG